MVYLASFFTIIAYSYFMGPIYKDNMKKFILQVLPIAILLLLMLGLQRNVGSDYSAYLEIGEGVKGIGWITNRGEILFAYLVYLVKLIGVPQLIFFLAGAIQLTFLVLTLWENKKIGIEQHYFWFAYFFLSLIFFNQFNGIRQYIAVYIFIYAMTRLLNGKWIDYVLLVFLAGLFHSSAYFLLILLPFKKLLEREYSILLITSFLLFFLIISTFDISNILKFFLSKTRYREYIFHPYFKRTPIENIITKIPKLAVVYYCIFRLKKDGLNSTENYLINLAFLSSIIMVLSFASTIVWRFYQYFDYFIIFPLVYYLQKMRLDKLRFVLVLGLFLMLFIKVVVVPKGEYLYNSILFVSGIIF